MELTIISSDKYTVAAVNIDGECPAIEFLENLELSYESNGNALYALFEKVSHEGLADIPAVLCHEVDKNEKIFEFIKGRLRIFFFKGKGDLVVICTTGILKKSQKVDQKQVNKAVKFKNQYLKAVEENTLEILEDK